MKVSFVQLGEKTRNQNGYGYAREMCESSLASLGHDVVFLDHTADVEINFIQPPLAKWSGCDYRVLYTPWESTTLPEGWLDAFNNVDEVWTPSQVIADIYEDAGVTKPIKVYEHGVDAIWSSQSRQRTSEGTFEILHHGGEALRKGANDVITGHTSLHYDARLTLKMNIPSGNIIDSDSIRIRPQRVPIEGLVDLYSESDLFAYPSWGEGFGLTPLQAMAGGMPVLITKGWAPYEDLLPPEFLIESEMVESPWQDIHPGKVWKPNAEDLRNKLMWHYKNRGAAGQVAWDLVPDVVARYDWVDLTEKAFAHLS